MFTIEQERAQIESEFSQFPIDIKIKTEILNMKQLEYIRKYGCKILVISSNICDDNGNLYIEEENGEASQVTP